MKSTLWIKVEIAYALPEEQRILTLQLRQGTTVQEALEQSWAQICFPHTELASMGVGVFGKVVPMTRVLKEGDRVEIYRPLIADPKQARRRRVQLARKTAVTKAG